MPGVAGVCLSREGVKGKIIHRSSPLRLQIPRSFGEKPRKQFVIRGDARNCSGELTQVGSVFQ